MAGQLAAGETKHGKQPGNALQPAQGVADPCKTASAAGGCVIIGFDIRSAGKVQIAVVTGKSDAGQAAAAETIKKTAAEVQISHRQSAVPGRDAARFIVEGQIFKPQCAPEARVACPQEGIGKACGNYSGVTLGIQVG